MTSCYPQASLALKASALSSVFLYSITFWHIPFPFKTLFHLLEMEICASPCPHISFSVICQYDSHLQSAWLTVFLSTNSVITSPSKFTLPFLILLGLFQSLPHPCPHTQKKYMYIYMCVCVCCFCLLAKSCPSLLWPMDCSLPGSSIHRISQARVLEWLSMPSSRGHSPPRGQTCVSSLAGRFFTTEQPGKLMNVCVCCVCI